MKTLKTLILLLVSWGCSSALADLPEPPSTLVIEWDAPTEREDGESLSLEEIAGYEVRNSCEAELIPVENSLAVAIPIEFPLDCIFDLRTVDTDGVRSNWSNNIRFFISRPGEPTLRRVAVNNLASALGAE